MIGSQEADVRGQPPPAGAPYQPQHGSPQSFTPPPQSTVVPETTATSPLMSSSFPVYNSMSGSNSSPPREGTLNDLPGYSGKSKVKAYLLAISPLGLIGAHHFYLRRYHWGILYFCTIGLGGFGYFFDWFRVPSLVREANARITNWGEIIAENTNEKSLSDAYVLWFPFGLLGFHHYYLGNYLLGVVFTLTIGFFGIFWIIDGIIMSRWVINANQRLGYIYDGVEPVAVSHLLGVNPPLGILWAHQRNLNRHALAVVDTFNFYVYFVVFFWVGFFTTVVQRSQQRYRQLR